MNNYKETDIMRMKFGEKKTSKDSLIKIKKSWQFHLKFKWRFSLTTTIRNRSKACSFIILLSPKKR